MRLPRPARLLPCALLLCLPPGARAALDYHTYRIVKETVEVRRGDESADSTRITYALSRLGPSSLEASSLVLTSHGSYLSVVEEATLTGNVENRPRDITHDFLLQGSLPVPPQAAIHSLSARHGDTLFQATLRKAVSSLNDIFFDTTALRATLDGRVAFLQQLSDRGFEAAFTRLSLGEPVRVRIAYDLPFPGAPGSPVRIPVLFHPSGQPPRQCQITFFEAGEGLPPVQWLSPSGRVTLEHAGTHTVAYQGEFQFRRDEALPTVATLQASAFEAGTWKGNYLHFKGGLNDSLMDLLSRPLEVVFLWRWNPPQDFIAREGGLKTLSPLGQAVAAQARAMRQIVQEFSPRGHRFGIYHSAPGREDEFLPPAEAGGAAEEDLLAYLDGFTEARLYADYKDRPDSGPEWAVRAWTDSGEIVKSRQDFLAVLGRIRGAFSDREESLKHIEMIGVGAAPATLLDLKDPGAIEDVIDSVTVANVLAPWLGVNMGEVLKLKANQGLRPLQVESPLAAGLPPLLFPVFQPSTVEYRAFTPARSHAVVMPFNPRAERSAIIKAEGAFADSLQLQGIDALGRKTRILALAPRILRSAADSGLARLWAADPDRIAEGSEVDLGMRYGILTKGTYWGAGVDDGVLKPGEPTPIRSLPKSLAFGEARVFSLEGGRLRIAPLTAMGPPGLGLRLDIYDLRGRLVLSLDLASFRTGNGRGGYSIALEALGSLGRARYHLVLRGAARLQSYSLFLGGRP